MRKNDSDPPASDSDPSLRENRTPMNAGDAPVHVMDAPIRVVHAPVGGTPPPASDHDPPLAKVIPLQRVSPDTIRAFLARVETRGMMTALVAGKVPPAHVDDLVQDAFKEVLETLERKPPERAEMLPGWVATIAHRVVADFLAKSARRAKHEFPMPDDPAQAQWTEGGREDYELPKPLAEPSYDPRAADDDSGVDPWLVRHWLAQQVANHPRDKETFEIVLEHAQGGKTYQHIAREREMTLTALSSRIFEFKCKYIPRYKKWRNRTVLLLLLGGAAVIVAIVVLWLLRRPDAIGPDPSWVPPSKAPAPSATASTPPRFDQALPPNPRSPDIK